MIYRGACFRSGKGEGRVYNVFGKDEWDGWVEMVTRGVFFSPP